MNTYEPYKKANKNEKGKYVNQKLFRGMIRSLIYLTVNRPDVIFNVSYVVDFKYILRYLI